MGEMARGLCQIVVSALRRKRDLARENTPLHRQLPVGKQQSKARLIEQPDRRCSMNSLGEPDSPGKANAPSRGALTGSPAGCPPGPGAGSMKKWRPCGASAAERAPKVRNPGKASAPAGEPVRAPPRGRQFQFRCSIAPFYPCTALIMSKMGRYMATIIPPTMTPRTTIMMGSMAARSASTAASTSSS